MTNYNDPLSTGPLGTGPVAGGPIVRSSMTPVFSMFSILAVVCALVALFNVAGPGLGFMLAIAAVVLGLLGMLEAVLPSRRGGIISFFAVGAGLLGIVVALYRLLGNHPGT